MTSGYHICKICKEPIRRQDLRRGCFVEKRKLRMLGVKFNDNYPNRRDTIVHKICLRNLTRKNNIVLI